MVSCKTVVTPLLTHWSYHRLARSHQFSSSLEFLAHISSWVWVCEWMKFSSVASSAEWVATATGGGSQFSKLEEEGYLYVGVVNLRLYSSVVWWKCWVTTGPERVWLCPYWMESVTLVVIIGTNTLVPFHFIKSLQLTGKSCMIAAFRCSLPALDMKVSCCELIMDRVPAF